MQIASIVDNQGVGFYVLDNEVTDLKVVVEIYTTPEHTLLDGQEIVRFLDENSPVAQKLSGYEPRMSQIDMAVLAAKSLNSGKITQIEAGIGTGKTLAYPVPAIKWALGNNECIVISTNTINLQEQIVHKDIPFLSSVFDEKFTYALVKGRGNYCCLQRTDSEERETLGLLKNDESIGELKTLLS